MKTHAAAIADSFKQSRKFTDANLAGFEPDTAHTRVGDGGSTAAWVLGHIVYWRNQAVAMLGGEPLWPTDAYGAFRGVDKGDAPDVLPRDFSRLVEDLDAVSTRLDEALQSADPEGEVWGGLSFLAVHDAYHSGQLGILRRAAGLAGAIGR